MLEGLKVDGSKPATLNDVEELFALHELREQEMFDKIMSAFPNRDIEGHCNYHQSKIEAAKAEKEFWDTAKKSVITNGVNGAFSLVKIILTLAALGLLAKYGIVLPFLEHNK
jgi:hypothetical protein